VEGKPDVIDVISYIHVAYCFNKIAAQNYGSLGNQFEVVEDFT